MVTVPKRAAAPDPDAANAAFLEAETTWFNTVLKARMEIYFSESGQEYRDLLAELPPPPLRPDSSPYATAVRALGLEAAERLVLMLAYLPHVRPQALDLFFTRNKVTDRAFSEFGGVPGSSHAGFLPTAETALFLLAGDNLRARFQYQHLFRPDHPLYARGVLRLHHAHPEEPRLSAALQVTPEYAERLATGRAQATVQK
jgi:hypothetical protein